MRKLLSLVSLFLLLSLLLCSCSTEYPKEGVYYCDELEFEMDFSLITKGSRQSCRLYTDNGSAFYYYYCEIDEERIILFDSNDNAYISGKYSFANDIFTIVEDGGEIELVFKKK